VNQLLGETESLCPECLRRIPATKIAENNNVYLVKSCPEHGDYKVLIWRGGAKHYVKWGQHSQEAVGPLKSLTNPDRGCPYDCGPCSEHKANACTMVVEVTQRCNLRCPVCFAESEHSSSYEPNLETIGEMFRTVLHFTGTPTIQLSGGEPTVRDDLPEIVALARRMGFGHIMINTNGVRIAKDTKYLQQLVNAGAGTIFLQFDGVTDDVYQYTRGTNLFELKVKAIGNCDEAKIGVILVPVVVPRVNDHQLGDIIQFAKKWIPTVKGVHFQPISYFGRYPVAPEDKDRVTIPDVIDGLVRQTGGELRPDNFLPRRSQDAHCAFTSLFVLGENNRLLPINRRHTGELVSGWGYTKSPWESARSFMNLHWQFSEVESGQCATGCCQSGSASKWNSWDNIYQAVATRGLTITCMPFQDVWNLDLERLKRCCGHVVTLDMRIIPFCAYYLTSASGKRLYANLAKAAASK
jgi:uncharacterized radical SAM superfamily Fe-S cluster-containing enzyme